MKRRDALKFSTTLFASACLPALAQHGGSRFDQGRPIYIEGKVVKSV